MIDFLNLDQLLRSFSFSFNIIACFDFGGEHSPATSLLGYVALDNHMIDIFMGIQKARLASFGSISYPPVT